MARTAVMMMMMMMMMLMFWTFPPSCGPWTVTAPRWLTRSTTASAPTAGQLSITYRGGDAEAGVRRFGEYRHPLHGAIRSVVTLASLAAGAELTVHYRYSLEDCPQWYSDLWHNLAC